MKKKTYILLSLVVCIWGIIGYKIFKSLNKKDEINQNLEISSPPITAKAIKKIKNYNLKVNYRDPFLGKLFVKKNIKNPSKKHYKKKEKITFPKIIYNGIIKGEKIKTYVITVNGRQKIFKIGEKKDDLKVVHDYDQYIIIDFKNVRKKIRINES